MLCPSKDKTREELDKLLHTDDVISMRLLCIEFDSELLFVAACSIWLHSVTCLSTLLILVSSPIRREVVYIKEVELNPPLFVVYSTFGMSQ